MENKDLRQMGFSSKSIHGGHQKNTYGALSTPIYQTSTFVFDTAEQGGRRFSLEEDGYMYSRLGNPSNTQIQEKLALLEGAEDAAVTSSGMGAVTSALWVSVSAGDHIIASKTLYGCTFSFLAHQITRFGVEVTFVDTRDIENVRNAMKSNTKVIYLESPANPNMYIADIRAISDLAHSLNPDCLVYVDSTYCTPYIQRPLDLGADVIIHSATKYLNGHGDVIAGFVVGCKDFIEKVKLIGIKDMTGASLSPFDSFLINRGMKTLSIRMERHCQSAMQVAEFLETHPMVTKVLYPGLKSFPQYELAKSQMKLPGAMIAFHIKGGLEGCKKFINSLKLCKLAVSLGDAETLIQHPASMTHSTYSPEERADASIAEDLIRLSVGLEDAQDIINDLQQGFEK